MSAVLLASIKHFLFLGWLAWLVLVARTVDGMLALYTFGFALVLVFDCSSFPPSTCGQ